MNYLEVVKEIVDILNYNNEVKYVQHIENAKLQGGTGGEILLIICSLLKTYEKRRPIIFSLIKKQALLLYKYCEVLGMKAIANDNLLHDLD